MESICFLRDKRGHPGESVWSWGAGVRARPAGPGPRAAGPACQWDPGQGPRLVPCGLRCVLPPTHSLHLPCWHGVPALRPAHPLLLLHGRQHQRLVSTCPLPWGPPPWSSLCPPPEGAARSPSAPTPHRALLGASPITEGCFCPQGMMLYSSSKEVCVPADCNSRFLGWASRAGLWASRHCPWLSAMTWGPPGPRLSLAVTDWGPRWPSSDLASFPPACLGPSGEPVEVSVGPSGAGGFSQPWRLTG